MAGQGSKALASGGSGGAVWEWFPAAADGWKGTQEVCLPLDRTVDFIYKELVISLRESKTRSLHPSINDCHTVVREPAVESLAIRPLRLLRSSIRSDGTYTTSIIALRCGLDCW
jgi:hypothetical protein